ncbi:MAG: DUF4332 domain-containing protein [Pseudomonadota bacterium]
MTVSEFQRLIAEQPFLWLALALVLGVLIGIRLGRWLERSVAASSPSSDALDDHQSTSLSDQAEDVGDLAELVGLETKQIKLLAAQGITGIDDLRSRTDTKQAREALADALQLEDFVVNKWARMADLLSLDGMSPETAEFLVYAGILSTQDLASRNAESVAHKLQNLNEKESRIEQTPTRRQLEAWIASVSAH